MKEIIIADLESSSDAAAIVSLLNEYATDIMGGGADLSDYTKCNLVDQLKLRSNCFVVLAYVDGTPAGLSINFEGFSTFACLPIMNIHDFAVAPQFRKQGLARAMLAKVEAVALERGCCKLTLEVLEGNQRAQSIYKAFGFDGYELDPKMGRAMFYEKKLS